MLFAALSLSAQKIGTNPLKAYRIVYSIGAEDEVGMDAAKHLQQVLSEKTGVELVITADNANAAGREIGYELIVNFSAKKDKENGKQ